MNTNLFTKNFLRDFKRNFNHRLKTILKQYNVTSFEDFFSGESPNQLTQKKSLFLLPLINISLQHAAKLNKINWEFKFEKEFDSILNGNKLQHKISLSDSNSWTVQAYSHKIQNYLLIKMTISGNKISGLFIATINLNECTKTKLNGDINGYHGFAELKIHNDDIDKVNIIAGKLIKKQKWCEVKLT